MQGVHLNLEGKVALITGGARGIGAETVRLFTEAGARVVFNYRQARERARGVVAECGGDNRCVGVEHELSGPADGRALVEAAVRAFGRLDILVANHGIWPPNQAPIARMSEVQWRRTMAVNLDSVFGLVQAAVAQFERQAGQSSAGGQDAASKAGQETGGTPSSGGIIGHMVLISSTAGQRGEAFHADYAASKGAIVSLTKSLSSELAPRGIRVNCVAPGWVGTEMSAPAVNNPAIGPKIAAAIPVGRVASPREIAGPVLFLCTPLAGFISGEVLNVNGGAVLVG